VSWQSGILELQFGIQNPDPESKIHSKKESEIHRVGIKLGIWNPE
jgi:hypothetical protein